jgi:hypothetical protein
VTDTFSGSRQGEGWAVATEDEQGGRASSGIEGSEGPRSGVDGECSAPRNGGRTVSRQERYDRKQRLRAARRREARASKCSDRQLLEGSASQPPHPAGIATGSGKGGVNPSEINGIPPNPPLGRPSTHPYGKTRPFYRPPHAYRATGGLTAAEEGEVLPQTVALGVEGTYEYDYSYTRATRAHYSQNRTKTGVRGEPLMNLADRGDRGSQAARISHFLERYGGSLREREVVGSDTSPGLQWFP